MSKTAPCSYSAVAGICPPNPSLVVELSHLSITEEDQLQLEILCDAINQKLITISPPQVKLAAIRWTAKGNLIITSAPTVTPHTLQIAAPHISAIISSSLQLPSDAIKSQPWPNVKWSKILINGIPMGVLKNRAPFSPDACHSSLAAINPSYASLTVTQKPSWVRPPSSYTPGSVSSLTLAFEDPDSSKLKALLAECYLYIYGNRASVKKWKQHQNNNKGKSKSNPIEHDQDSTSGAEDAISTLPSPAHLQSSSTPLVQTSQSL
jgi:hypothetical protein